MYLYGRSEADLQKRIDVSDDIKDKFLNLARKEFLTGYGKSDGEEQSVLTKKYLMSLPENQRLHASNTLNDIYRNEAKRLQDIAKERIPNWQSGKPFDPNIFADVITGGIDKKIQEEQYYEHFASRKQFARQYMLDGNSVSMTESDKGNFIEYLTLNTDSSKGLFSAEDLNMKHSVFPL